MWLLRTSILYSDDKNPVLSSKSIFTQKENLGLVDAMYPFQAIQIVDEDYEK
jgi:hypothetical protein